MLRLASSTARVSDRRAQRSLVALIDATSQLVDEGPIAGITITRIVELAGLTRPTFYQHFPDVPAAARAAAIQRLEAASALPIPVAPEDLLSPDRVRRCLALQMEPVLRHLVDHRTFYRRVLDSAADTSFFSALVSLSLTRTSPEWFDAVADDDGEARDDVVTAVAAGIAWLIIRWLESHEPPLDPGKMSHRIANVCALIIHQRR